uniref:Uncharacterized protein n=1 Tax=Sexangularia sp. CB-2014 TaxID=1486929 RepID=A0A7S1VUP8_9EUKA
MRSRWRAAVGFSLTELTAAYTVGSSGLVDLTTLSDNVSCVSTGELLASMPSLSSPEPTTVAHREMLNTPTSSSSTKSSSTTTPTPLSAALRTSPGAGLNVDEVLSTASPSTPSKAS